MSKVPDKSKKPKLTLVSGETKPLVLSKLIEPGAGRLCREHERFELAIDNKRVEIEADRLLDSSSIETLLKELAAAKRVRVLRLDDLLFLQPAARINLIGVLASCRNIAFRVEGRNKDFSSPLDAALTLNIEPDSAYQLAAWQLFVVELIVMLHPEATEMLAARVADRIREMGFKGITASSVLKKIKEVRAAISKVRTEKTALLLLSEVWTDLPCDEAGQLQIPPTWKAESNGIVKLFGQGKTYNVPRMFISEVLEHKATQSQSVQLCWFSTDTWKSRVVSRELIADVRKIVALAEYGVPVTSNNAKGCIEFLAEFEAANCNLVQRSEITSQFGWQADGESGFLLGAKQIAAPAVGNVALGGRKMISFRGADDGDNQLAVGYRTCGCWLYWDLAVRNLQAYPHVMFSIYAALAAPLLRIVGGGSFVIDYAGPTTRGKTTVLGIAASVYGECDPTSQDSLIRQFHSTQVYRERLLSITCDLPAFLDETKLARDNRDIAGFAYLAGTGKGRGRGTTKGLGWLQTTRNIVFTSGEQPITSYTKDGGTCARVFTIWGSPFGATSQSIASLIRRVNHGVQTNYGHAGFRFIQFLAANRESWPDFKKRHEELTACYLDRAGDNVVAYRLAASLAVIRLAAELAKQSGALSLMLDPIEPIYCDLVRELKQADRAAEALKFVVDWAISNRKSFATNGSLPNASISEILGNFRSVNDSAIPLDEDKAPDINWLRIEVVLHVLERALAEAGFEADAIRRTWRDRRWLVTDEDRLTTKTKIGPDRLRVVAITQKGYQEASSQ